MSTLVFDIETRPFDTSVSEAALSPLTSALSLLGVYDLERDVGTVYVISNKDLVDGQDDPRWQFKSNSEVVVLEEFWLGTQSYDVFVGFGTRRFDVPFLMHRSIASSVRPSMRLMKQKVLSRQELPYHVDLLDEYSFYGQMSRSLSLIALAKLYQLSEIDNMLTYDVVAEAAEEEDLESLYKHMIAKLTVTAKLYGIWKTNLAPPQFMNTIDL